MAEPDYQVKLDIFEGPLDLLLHLIRKNEVDIADIPISLITAQYIEYIEMMKSLNLTLAGEFLLMAATLVHIKSRLLVPRIRTGQEGEADDPRLEIVQPLMEYMRLKKAAEHLEERDLLGRDVFVRGDYDDALGEPEQPVVVAGFFDLIDAFGQLLERRGERPGLEVPVERKRLSIRMDEILARLTGAESLGFEELFNGRMTRSDIVVTFLALLELARRGKLSVFQTEPRGPIRLFLKRK